jgi:hypothetical protein
MNMFFLNELRISHCHANDYQIKIKLPVNQFYCWLITSTRSILKIITHGHGIYTQLRKQLDSIFKLFKIKIFFN